MTRLADIIIPTFNRYDELPKFFSHNAALENENVNVYVIDDHSTKKDVSVLPAWDNLFFIQQDVNRGQAFARNVGIEKGNAPYIISLDDDAWFIDVAASIQQLKVMFDQNPKAGCIMFNIATPNSDYSTMPTGTRLALHVTCGCAYRRQTLKHIGGFSGFLHSQAEESDISLRIHKAGWEIVFANEIKVFHNFNPVKRSLEWYYTSRHNTIRNDLLIVLMHYPSLLVLPFLTGKYLSHARFVIKNRISVMPTLFYVLKAGLNFVRLSPQALRMRRPLKIAQLKEWRNLVQSNLKQSRS